VSLFGRSGTLAVSRVFPVAGVSAVGFVMDFHVFPLVALAGDRAKEESGGGKEKGRFHPAAGVADRLAMASGKPGALQLRSRASSLSPMRPLQSIPMFLFPLVLWNCAGAPAGRPEIGANPFGPTGIPPELRGNDEQGTPIAAGGNTPAAVNAALAAYDPNELVWTDADNPDAEIPELQGLMAVAPQKGPWRESETDALRESKRSGKPLVIWFTDSVRSSACKSLSSGLLTRSDFEEWASENTVRLIVDQSVKGRDIEDDARKKIHVRGLKKKYSARGHPTLLVLSPSGEVLGRYKSYRKGQEDFIWGQLKQGVSLAAESHKSWKAGLERKGYRDWSDGKGRVIFAKLAGYREGEVLLVEPDGQRARTHEDRLSAGDRVWIGDQKRLRGIP